MSFAESNKHAFGELEPSPRLLFFSHDTFGLGHLRRCTAIAHACSSILPDASILYVTGSPVPGSFDLPAGCDIVKLPQLTKDDHGRYVSGALDVSLDLAVSLRRGLITEAIRRFDPHLVLIDHAPLGAAEELRPALDALRKRRPATRVILGLRDVLDEPNRVATEFGDETIASLIRRYFDDVLIYGDRRVFDPVAEYDFPEDVARRVEFTGYVTACAAPRERQRNPSRKPRIVITTGGGCDGLTVHEMALAALAGPLAELDCEVEMTFGPLADATHRNELMARAERDPRIDAAIWRPELHSSLVSADVVVGMAGANTVAEILAADVPAILVPRQRPRREQALRANRLERLGLARVVNPDSATAPLELAESIRRAISGELLPRLRPRTDGAKAVALHLARALMRDHQSVHPSLDSGSPALRVVEGGSHA